MASRVLDDRSGHEPRAGRRAWLADVLRWLTLGGLGAVSVRLMVQGDDCSRQPTCQSCGLIARCGLPRAASARREPPRSK